MTENICLAYPKCESCVHYEVCKTFTEMLEEAECEYHWDDASIRGCSLYKEKEK